MNPLVLITMLIAMFLFVGIAMFVAFTRQGRNLYVMLAHKKKYVICHLKNSSTEFIDDYRVVPEPGFYTKVGKGTYNLNPNYAIMNWRGRLHFNLDENDSIPRYINRSGSKEEILQQTNEIETALNTNAYDELYKKEQQIALILCAIGLVIAILTSIYTIYELNKIYSMLEYYSNIERVIAK